MLSQQQSISVVHCSLEEEEEEEVGPGTLQQLLTDWELLLLHWLQVGRLLGSGVSRVKGIKISVVFSLNFT